ncbi:MAG: response regulator [Desulfobacteraceae bacterium]
MQFTILLTDDSSPMRKVLKKTFKAAGYAESEFLEAADGKQGLEKLRNHRVDIVITDYTMPEMDGLEMIRAIKNDPALKHIPVVAVTTEGSSEIINRFMEQGAEGYIKKPFTPEQLRDLLVKILGVSDYDQDTDASDSDFDF